MLPLIAGGLALGGAAIDYFSSRRDRKRAQRQADIARAEMNQQKVAFEALDTSNPFLGMQNQFAGLENTMEDLTVNQQQAQFEAQQGQQQRANILDQMRGAAGGSGIASLAQAMAQQGQLASQRASASIGQQEAANERAMAAEAGRLQMQEAQGAMNVQNQIAQGEVISRNLERDKVSTMLGMTQGEFAGAQDRMDAARASQYGALSGGLSSLGSIAMGGLG